ncbi:uncharacterized protein LOC114063692 isoform X2 [Empidonax traillii]|uniref:uncharacterized protein LOC114063692 isoform X2 n=1 Tax=Empidonax traillii TaxID=164674 RepID=UPI000FFD0BD9|nr:uncharacterized protein LOC114063692 isoform X2 [Empidonax traillii]
MSESSSGLTTSNEKFCESYLSCCSILRDTPPIPGGLSQGRGIVRPSCDPGLPPPLPSDSFKYLGWCDIEEHDVRGNQLLCPRVREGPSEEELFFRREECPLKKRKQVTDTEKWEKRLQENWENCAELNLSFQDLGDLYQVENFQRILRRLIRVEKLWLVDNSLTDLSAIRLPSVFSSLPNLKMLDGIPKLPEDCSPPEIRFFYKMCTIL